MGTADLISSGLVLISIIAAASLQTCLAEAQPASEAGAAASPPVYGYEVIRAYPHDRGAFTEGLIYDRGYLYEGTGQYGRSSIRKVDLETGKVLLQHNLSPGYFGEGLTSWRDRLIQLTWQSGLGFIYDKSSFELLGNFRYRTEGWGITHNQSHLFLSDGTDILHLLDPGTFEEVGTIPVRYGGMPVNGLNELEYLDGSIFANVWTTDYIVMISPITGEVVGLVDLSGLLSPEEKASTDVLNGIAYDALGDRLLVTGKFWPKIFHIELEKAHS